MPSFSPKEKFLKFQDYVWDGKISGPPKSKIFDKVYDDYTLPPEARKVVIVEAVRGPAGRVGLRRGDVVTHFNDLAWEGTAEELMNEIYEVDKHHRNQEISFTVNANAETAAFLKLRHKLLVKAKVLT